MGGETTISTRELTELAGDYVLGRGPYKDDVSGSPKYRGLELIQRGLGDAFVVQFEKTEADGHLLYGAQHYPRLGMDPY